MGEKTGEVGEVISLSWIKYEINTHKKYICAYLTT